MDVVNGFSVAMEMAKGLSVGVSKSGRLRRFRQMVAFLIGWGVATTWVSAEDVAKMFGTTEALTSGAVSFGVSSKWGSVSSWSWAVGKGTSDSESELSSASRSLVSWDKSTRCYREVGRGVISSLFCKAWTAEAWQLLEMVTTGSGVPIGDRSRGGCHRLPWRELLGSFVILWRKSVATHHG